MTKATISGPAAIDVEYYRPVDASAFDPTTFSSVPTTEQANSMINIFPNLITLFFLGAITGDTLLTYTGDTPGIRSPQNVPLT